jgi:hypothetical protein
MSDVITSLFVDVPPSNGKLTEFIDGDRCLIASTVSEFSLWQMLLRVLADECASSLSNALYGRRSSRFEIAFQSM